MEMDYLIKLIETVSRSELSKFEYEEGGVKVQMEKPEAVQVMQVAPVLAGSAVQAEETAAGDNVVTCPLVGIFYAAPEEGAEPFVKVLSLIHI